MIEFCKAAEDRDTCLLRRGHIEDHEYGDPNRLVALAWQAGVDRVFVFLDRFNLMDKFHERLVADGAGIPLPEEHRALHPGGDAVLDPDGPNPTLRDVLFTVFLTPRISRQ